MPHDFQVIGIKRYLDIFVLFKQFNVIVLKYFKEIKV